MLTSLVAHDDVIIWKHFLRYWPFVRGIHRTPVNSPHKGQWRGAVMFSLICAWINSWLNNREVGDLRRHSAHYDVTVMLKDCGTMSIIEYICALLCFLSYVNKQLNKQSWGWWFETTSRPLWRHRNAEGMRCYVDHWTCMYSVVFSILCVLQFLWPKQICYHIKLHPHSTNWWLSIIDISIMV